MGMGSKIEFFNIAHSIRNLFYNSETPKLNFDYWFRFYESKNSFFIKSEPIIEI